MAHHKFDVLQELLKDLDDERNDIYLHIDKKSKDVPWAQINKSVKKSKLVFVKPMKVFWGHSSQISCVLKLLQEALKKKHDYYHLLVGVEFPIKNQDEIHDFFENNSGKEFIGFDQYDNDFLKRIRYYYIFGKFARGQNIIEKKLYLICEKLVEIQRKYDVNRISGDMIEYKKGYANWSITEALAKYILANELFIKKRMQFTYCADEILFHTLVYNSGFKDKVYNFLDEYDSCQRLTTWTNSYNRFFSTDVPRIVASGKLFVRKIDGDDALDVIKMIKESRNNGKYD